MLKISTRGQYGIAAILAISHNEKLGPMPIKKISEEIGVSIKYLEQIFITLKKSGFVKSTRGPRGGYVLSRKPSLLSIKDILESLEGELKPVFCVADEVICDNAKNCGTKTLWMEMNDNIQDIISNITIEKLSDDYGKYLKDISYMQFI